MFKPKAVDSERLRLKNLSFVAKIGGLCFGDKFVLL